MPPNVKPWRSDASRTTAITSGCSAIGWTNGTGLYGPNRRLNATCCAGVSDCPRSEHDTVVEHRAPDLRDDRVGKVVGEIDTADHRAAHARPRLDARRYRYGEPLGSRLNGEPTPSPTRPQATGRRRGIAGHRQRSVGAPSTRTWVGSPAAGNADEHRPGAVGRCPFSCHGRDRPTWVSPGRRSLLAVASCAGTHRAFIGLPCPKEHGRHRLGGHAGIAAGSVESMKSVSTRTKRSGSSQWGKCPTPSKISTRLLGNVAWAAAAWWLGMIASLAPHTMRVGMFSASGNRSCAHPLTARADDGAQRARERDARLRFGERFVALPDLLDVRARAQTDLAEPSEHAPAGIAEAPDAKMTG